MSFRSVLARTTPASSAPADRGYVSARPASRVEPAPNLSLAAATRFGHDFARLPAPGSFRADVLQLDPSDDEDEEDDSSELPSESSEDSEPEDEDDEDFVMHESKSKNKKTDPNSAFKPGTLLKKGNKLTYETKGGAQHQEEYDPKTNQRRSTTTGLKYLGPEFRNNAIRPKDNEGLKVHNPYKLSVGQSTLNQLIVSHNTPSWAGMRAGGEFGNHSLTSPVFNSQVEKKEKRLRDLVTGSTKPFDYETHTQYEEIDPEKDAPRIAPLMTNKKWKDVKRVKNRLERAKKLAPYLKRVASETRKVKHGKKTSSFSIKGGDLHFTIPRRAYDKKAHKKYIEARGQDSEGSDEELTNPKPKKKVKTKKN